MRPPQTDEESRIGHQGASPARIRLAVSRTSVEPTYHQLSRGDFSMKARVALWSSFPLLITAQCLPL